MAPDRGGGHRRGGDGTTAGEEHIPAGALHQRHRLGTAGLRAAAARRGREASAGAHQRSRSTRSAGGLTYEDPAFFRRLFKRITGISPGSYRRQFQIPAFAARAVTCLSGAALDDARSRPGVVRAAGLGRCVRAADGRGSRGGTRARGPRAARDCRAPGRPGRGERRRLGAGASRVSGPGRGPGGGAVRVLARLHLADPGRAGAQRRLARPGPAAAGRWPARLRGARVPARAPGAPAHVGG